MLLYITGGVGFALSVLAIILILIVHKKDKKKLIPIIMYVLGFVLFMGSGFLHWRGVRLDLPLPSKEPAEDVQQAEDSQPEDTASPEAQDTQNG